MSLRPSRRRKERAAAAPAEPTAPSGDVCVVPSGPPPPAGATPDGHAIAPADHVPDVVLQELSAAFASGSGTDEAVAAAVGEGAPRKVIVIEEDELPDAEYLDSDPLVTGKEIGGDAPRVVIGDLDGETGEAVPVATSSSVDPRMRARRIAVRRAEGRKRLRWFLVGGAVLAVIAGILAVLGSPLFSIEQIEVDGAVYTDPEVVAEVVASLEGEPILLADLDAAARRLEEAPWVESARVTRHFPDRVVIQVAERVPLAAYRGGDGLYRVVDIDGRVLAVLEGRPVDVVELVGTGPDVSPGADAGPAIAGAARLVNALPPAVRSRVSLIGVTATGELTLILDNDTDDPIQVVFGLPEGYQDKLVAVVNELARHEPGEISVIDVSTGEPTVR